jgi:hypothetical protein
LISFSTDVRTLFNIPTIRSDAGFVATFQVGPTKLHSKSLVVEQHVYAIVGYGRG